MAEIDKPLPNTKTTIEVPGEVEIQEAIKENVEEVETKGGPVEIEMTEEGGAEVSFDPKAASPEGGEDHFENLAEFLGEEILDPLGSKLFDQYNEYKESRGDWEETYRNGSFQAWVPISPQLCLCISALVFSYLICKSLSFVEK